MVPEWFKKHAEGLREELGYVETQKLAVLAGSPAKAVALIYTRKALSVFAHVADVYIRRKL